MYIQWNAQILIVCLLSFDKCLQTTSHQDAEIIITPEISLMFHPSHSPQHTSQQPRQPYLWFFPLPWISFACRRISHRWNHTVWTLLHVPAFIQQRRQWHPTPVSLPGKSHGRRSLVGCSPWGCYESDTTERLNFHFSLSCTGEGNGNPLQCSCLENPRDGGAWWAAIYGAAQSQTRLKRLSSSSSSFHSAQCFWGSSMSSHTSVLVPVYYWPFVFHYLTQPQSVCRSGRSLE